MVLLGGRERCELVLRACRAVLWSHLGALAGGGDGARRASSAVIVDELAGGGGQAAGSARILASAAM